MYLLSYINYFILRAVIKQYFLFMSVKTKFLWIHVEIVASILWQTFYLKHYGLIIISEPKKHKSECNVDVLRCALVASQLNMFSFFFQIIYILNNISWKLDASVNQSLLIDWVWLVLPSVLSSWCNSAECIAKWTKRLYFAFISASRCLVHFIYKCFHRVYEDQSFAYVFVNINKISIFNLRGIIHIDTKCREYVSPCLEMGIKS